jgi:predicted P-loop ATPase
MIFGDPENSELYDTMFHKWFVGMVKLWRGKSEENPIMPVLCGHQHIGKTYYIRHILPPLLASYLFPVNPSSRVDKDFEIAMSETPLMFLDEFSVSNQQKSEAYKYAITASKSYLRDSYDHFREMRTRKASLIAATNHESFIREAEGDRRYLAVNLTGTVNLNDHPLPYEGAYAQALWLLDHGYSAKPTQQESELISEHNLPYLIPDDVDEALRTFVRKPEDTDNPEAYTAGDLLGVLYAKGFRGPKYTSQAIAKAMKGMGIDYIKRQGRKKYVVVIADSGRQQCERKKDVDDVEPF